jgi:hypothetical protein
MTMLDSRLQVSRKLENSLLFMEVRKQKSGEERMKEQSTSETVCFAWRNPLL